MSTSRPTTPKPITSHMSHAETSTPRPTTPRPTTGSRVDTELKGSEFWEVFIQEIPRVPTVDELICRIVGMSYPDGMFWDRDGNLISPPLDHQAVTKQVLFTLQVAIDTEREFWIKQCRYKGVYTPYAWAVRLGASISDGGN
ncbi:hypothetical protein RRF57_012911 [Xylaria bambusicola]|uniref:Uncharacterized protein n=1 Tax=Xylaria bambusicola TaxID=326684 RepID=A0AAN7V4Q0_9PEZI